MNGAGALNSAFASPPALMVTLHSTTGMWILTKVAMAAARVIAMAIAMAIAIAMAMAMAMAIALAIAIAMAIAIAIAMAMAMAMMWRGETARCRWRMRGTRGSTRKGWLYISATARMRALWRASGVPCWTCPPPRTPPLLPLLLLGDWAPGRWRSQASS